MRRLVSAAIATMLWLSTGCTDPTAAEPGPAVPEALASPGATSGPPARTGPQRSRQYFVSNAHGSDRATGSRAHPWRTLQHAVDHAPAHSVISVGRGHYRGFVMRRPQTVRGQTRAHVVITGPPGRNVVELAAAGSTLSSLTVAGCRPDATPPGGVADHPTAGIRVDASADRAVIDHVTVRDGTAGSGTYRLGCHGVFLYRADHVRVSSSELARNASGIYVDQDGRGDRLTDNYIHDNAAMVRDTPRGQDPNDDYGAVGIGFDRVSQAPGPVAQGNRLVRNRARSYDYGTDGSGFEIFASSHVTMRSNTIVDNDVVLETGTSSNRVDCADNLFTHNTTRGSTTTATDRLSRGLILRCAKDMQITDNTIDDAEYWAFVVGGSDAFSASIRGLTITGNTIRQRYDQMYASADEPGSWGVTIEDNTYTWLCTGSYRFASWGADPRSTDQVPSFNAWRQRFGYDTQGSTGQCS